MSVTEEPATDQQMAFLRHFGHVTSQPISKSEATHLLRIYHERAHEMGGIPVEGVSLATRQEVCRLHQEVELARKMASHELETVPAVVHRQEFWMDTCREVREMHQASSPVCELYKLYGCRFSTPTHEQVQVLLDALDSALPSWERDHPDLFYQTLELNYPGLVHRVV